MIPGVEGWPICARCKKPVDVVERVPDSTSFFADCYLFRVRCHGAMEETRLSGFSLLEVRSVRFGEAFREKPALPPSETVNHRTH